LRFRGGRKWGLGPTRLSSRQPQRCTRGMTFRLGHPGAKPRRQGQGNRMKKDRGGCFVAAEGSSRPRLAKGRACLRLPVQCALLVAPYTA